MRKLILCFALSLVAKAAVTIDTLWVVDGEVGVAYTQTFTASGGTAPYTWTVSAGALPNLITLDGATGIISGTPNTAATSSFTLTVTDAGAATFAIPYTMLVYPANDYVLYAYGPSPAWKGWGAGIMSLTARGAIVPSSDHLYLNSITGLPIGVTGKMWCSSLLPIGHANCFTEAGGAHRSYQYGTHTILGQTTTAVEFRFVADRTAIPGTYPVTITTAININGGADVVHSITVNLIVKDVTFIAPNQTMTSGNPTGLATWQTAMTTQATKWGITNFPPAWCFSVACEVLVWYYDGAQAFYRTGDYIGANTYLNAAQVTADVYANSVNTGLQNKGWHLFPGGMEQAWMRGAPTPSSPTEYTDAIIWLAERSPFAAYAGVIPSLIPPQALTAMRDSNMRETALILDSYMMDTHLGRIPTPNFPGRTAIDEAADRLILDFYMEYTAGANTSQVEESIYDGFGAEVLIKYWKTNGDPRVPEVLKAFMDYAWANLINNATGEWQYMAFNKSIQCDAACPNASPFDYRDISDQQMPMFWWYYALTGNTTYRDRGDVVFNNCILPPDTGKEFSQNYRWTLLDGIVWRTKGLYAGVNH